MKGYGADSCLVRKENGNIEWLDGADTDLLRRRALTEVSVDRRMEVVVLVDPAERRIEVAKGDLSQIGNFLDATAPDWREWKQAELLIRSRIEV